MLGGELGFGEKGNVPDSSPSRFALLAIAGRSVTTSPGSQPGKGPQQCIMLRTAGRTLSRALHRSVPGRGLAPSPAPAAVASRRWFNAGGLHLAGHAGQLDEFGIATGAEREELEYQREGKRRFDLEPPRGPFGTKEAPAVVESQYDERIVGCSGGVGEDEHDVTWFNLEKGQTHECPVCTQVFELKVIGVGGKPGHDEHH